MIVFKDKCVEHEVKINQLNVGQPNVGQPNVGQHRKVDLS